MSNDEDLLPHPKVKSYSVVPLARLCLAKNRFDFHPHCEQRMGERAIGADEILEVLNKGDFLRDDHKHGRLPPWSYLMGGTVDERFIMVALHFWKDKAGDPWLVLYTCWTREE